MAFLTFLQTPFAGQRACRAVGGPAGSICRERRTLGLDMLFKSNYALL